MEYALDVGGVMKRLGLVLTLLLLVVVPVQGWITVNLQEKGYVAATSFVKILASGSVDVTPPIVGGDTLTTRGFMIGYRSTAHGQDHSLQIMYREAGDGGWYRWNEWENASVANYGLPLPSRWQGLGGTNGLGCTPFMPMADLRMLRLFNRTPYSLMNVVVIWFMDSHVADSVDWTTWSMP